MRPSDLKPGKEFEWTLGAEFLKVKYIGKAKDNPDIKPGSNIGRGYIFQWVNGNGYVELSLPALQKAISPLEDEV